MFKSNAPYVKLINQAVCAIREQAYSEAETHLNNALKLDKRATEAQNLLGVTYANQGDHLLALRHFRMALELDPNFIHARMNIESLTHHYFTGSQQQPLWGFEDFNQDNSFE